MLSGMRCNGRNPAEGGGERRRSDLLQENPVRRAQRARKENRALGRGRTGSGGALARRARRRRRHPDRRGRAVDVVHPQIRSIPGGLRSKMNVDRCALTLIRPSASSSQCPRRVRAIQKLGQMRVAVEMEAGNPSRNATCLDFYCSSRLASPCRGASIGDNRDAGVCSLVRA